MTYGGYWDKLGNTYEDSWALRLLVDLTSPTSNILNIVREPVGDDEKGVDIWVSREDGAREAHQCKRAKEGAATWTLATLAAEGIFKNLRFQLERDFRHEYRFVSGTQAPELSRFVNESRNSQDPESFWVDQVKPVAALSSSFEKLCRYFELSAASADDRAAVWGLLRRTKVILFIDGEEEWSQLKEGFQARLEGSAEPALACLAKWARDQLRNPIDLESVRKYLVGAKFKLIADDPFPGEVVEALQARFSDSLAPLLAGGELISRSETQEALALLADEEVRVVVIHGSAGSGKSGVLFELFRDLLQTSVALPIRLDRVNLEGDPAKFGKALGLRGSPGKSLALLVRDGRQAVLLLDQLDALRWTSAHSSEAWDVCREMIADALAATTNTKVVVCCRTFDLEHDPQFKLWKESAKNLRAVEVNDLPEEQVRAAVAKVADKQGPARSLTDGEVKLLRHVLHLKMWLKLYPQLGAQGSLSTRRALLEAFWQNRRDRLREAGIAPERREKIEERLITVMQGGARLFAPEAALQFSQKEASAYRSLQLLQVHQGKVSFCHQSYLDYLVALRVVEELEQGGKGLLNWIGPPEKQTLFRREQLRIVLEELRDRDPKIYMNEMRALLLAGGRIRFHLRLLCLQFLSQIQEPLSQEGCLVLDLIEDPYWREHVLQNVIAGRASWFDVLANSGNLERWLAGEEELRDKALWLLRSVAEKRGDRVAALVSPYLEVDGWGPRVSNLFWLDPGMDSERLFALRLQVLKIGLWLPQYIGWRELADSDSPRFKLLLASILESIISRIGKVTFDEQYLRGVFYGLEGVDPRRLSAEIRDQVLSFIALFLLRFDRNRAGWVGKGKALWFSEFDVAPIQQLFDFFRSVGRMELEEDWKGFVYRCDLRSIQDVRFSILFLDILKGGPIESDLADWSIRCLISDPERLRMRLFEQSSSWLLAGQLVARFAPVCSEATLRALEDWLLDYRDPDFGEIYARRPRQLLRNEDMGRYSWFGYTAHCLLERVPEERRSLRVKLRMAELERKFGWPPSLECSEAHIQAGHVRSPLGFEILLRMGTGAVRRLATSGKLRERSALRWKNREFVETSAHTIANDFRLATQQQPERFGRLLVDWPEQGHLEFFEAIFAGLSKVRAHGRELGPDWQAPSHQLLEKVLTLPLVQRLIRDPAHNHTAMVFCHVIEDYPEYPWSESVLDLLIWIAREHSDPVARYFPMGSMDTLESNALNVTRARAGYAIRALPFKRPGLLTRLMPAIESLILDPHPAVRTTAAGVCLGMFELDGNQAVDFFLESVRGREELLMTREAKRFFLVSRPTHLQRLLETLEGMCASEDSKVATAGAVQIAAAWLVNGQVESRFEECVVGSAAHREGVALVAAELVRNPEYSERAIETLLRLQDAPEAEVARAVARGFGGLSLQHYLGNREAWASFARSYSFQVNPAPLLHALGQQAGNLLPFADCVLAAGQTFANELAPKARDLHGGLGSEARFDLQPLLLRLYEQAQKDDPEVALRCLDLWDRLLEQRLNWVMKLTEELDRL